MTLRLQRTVVAVLLLAAVLVQATALEPARWLGMEPAIAWAGDDAGDA
jgi:hypothetical protein